jgi:hypothetical protein
VPHQRAILGEPPDEHRVAAARLWIGVLGFLALFVACLVGIALVVASASSVAERAAGGAVLVAAIIGMVRLFRWAGGLSWRYDRPRRELGVSEAIVLGAATVLAFGLLYAPLGVWSLLVFAAPVVPVARLRYGMPLADALVVGALFAGALLALVVAAVSS